MLGRLFRKKKVARVEPSDEHLLELEIINGWSKNRRKIQGLKMPEPTKTNGADQQENRAGW